MTNRREFLQAATALSAAPLVGRAAFAVGHEPVKLDAVIYDSRHAEARDFAVRADKLGAPVHGINGDVTDIWQDVLLDCWSSKPAAVAGLTERTALFLLERLAWDHNLRVVFEAEHIPDYPGQAEHRIIRTADNNLAGELVSAGRHWPSELAESMIARNRAASSDFRPSETAMASTLDEPVKLCSWIIAPRVKA